MPSSRSTISSMGLSRRSSVPSLKLYPSTPTRRCSLLKIIPSALHLLLVAGQDRAENRDLDVQPLGSVVESPYVLRQAGSAERESRLQIVGGQVQLRVRTEDVHRRDDHRSLRLAEVADLVGEADLEGVPDVVRVLHHLGRPDLRPNDRRIEKGIEGRDDALGARVRSPDHGLRRVEEIMDRGALAQELRVDAHPEVDPGLSRGALFERRDDHFVGRPGSTVLGSRRHGSSSSP